MRPSAWIISSTNEQLGMHGELASQPSQKQRNNHLPYLRGNGAQAHHDH